MTQLPPIGPLGPASPVGIVDIGSNSIRFVAYGGDKRVPAILFNEKVMAGLGTGLARSGALEAKAMERALGALRRFALLTKHLKLKRVLTVATAAVRDASNGVGFMERVRALGFEPMLIPGREEAELAGHGVLSAIPEADGIAADLGGGSLELIRVADGRVGEGVSLPLGVLRLDVAAGRPLADEIAAALAGTGLAREGAGKPLYLVGGSWRALGNIDLFRESHPLPIVHQHAIAPARIAALGAYVGSLDRETAKAIPSLSLSRLPTLPAAAALLEALSQTVMPSSLIVCAYGLREGLLYRDLTPGERRIDPLLAAAREIGQRYGRFGAHGELIDRWIAPMFSAEPPGGARIRLAACLLADIAWGAHPDFRAERAVDMALHGNWVAIDAAGRAMLGLTLFTAFGATGGFDPGVAALCLAEETGRAAQWGNAIRLAQRFSGGVSGPLENSTLRLGGGALTLSVPAKAAALYGEPVARRHRTLAASLGAEARFQES